MKKFVFISVQNKGWTNIEVPNELNACSYEQFRNWTSSLERKYDFKGLLITENPSPYPLEKH